MRAWLARRRVNAPARRRERVVARLESTRTAARCLLDEIRRLEGELLELDRAGGARLVAVAPRPTVDGEPVRYARTMAEAYGQGATLADAERGLAAAFNAYEREVGRVIARTLVAVVSIVVTALTAWAGSALLEWLK